VQSRVPQGPVQGALTWGLGAGAQALAVMRAGAPGLLAWLAMCVSRVVDIEEAVWAPRYGLKGMVDASVELGFAAGPPARTPRPARSRPMYSPSGSK